MELLQKEDSSIAEIAIRCGFSSPSYFSRVFKTRVARGVEDKIRGAEKNEKSGDELCAGVEGVSVNRLALTGGEDDENADRQKDKAEKRACKNGELVVRRGKLSELKACKENRGRGEDRKNCRHRQSERAELGLCLKREFVVIGVEITDHQDRSPNGKHDAGQHGKCEITE